ncbi:MAG TPA: hypothetical protein VIL48_13370 [Acidimicrobiales bacterium]
MKFKLGLAIGFAAGYWLGTQADEERKRQVEEAVGKIRDNPRVQRVTDSVSRGAGRLTDVVEERLVTTSGGAADRSGSSAESGASNSGSSGSESSG